MTIELTYLAMVAVLTGLLWIPYILNVLLANPLSAAMGYPREPLVMAPWAERLKKAHYNSVENLVVFAAVVLAANAADISNAATQSAVVVYFWARAVHAIAYAGAIPYLRTLAFTVAWLAILCVAAQILMP